MMEDLLERLDQIKMFTLIGSKNMLTHEEAAFYLGISSTHLTKLKSNRKIPYYQPQGKICYFDKSELDEWMRQGKVKTLVEVENDALAHIANKCKKSLVSSL